MFKISVSPAHDYKISKGHNSLRNLQFLPLLMHIIHFYILVKFMYINFRKISSMCWKRPDKLFEEGRQRLTIMQPVSRNWRIKI